MNPWDGIPGGAIPEYIVQGDVERATAMAGF